MKIKNKILLNLFYKLMRIRNIELEISKRYHEHKMRCPVHLSLGQESVSIAICENLKSEDEVVSAHRAHAHYLAKGGDLKKFVSELYGKITGCAKGLGGSMHLIDTKVNFNAAVPIVGSTIPIGVGKAWANKLKKNNKVVVIFFGDGATEEGTFLESLDFSSLHNLKVLFVCENNSYSVYSHLYKRQSKKRSITNIAKACGVDALKFNNHDLINIFIKTKNIINQIKKKSKPFLIEIKTFRQVEHCGPSEDDNLNYRSKSEINFWKKNCQVEIYKKKILKIINKDKLLFFEKKIQKEINNAFYYAEKSKFPDKKEFNKYIYA